VSQYENSLLLSVSDAPLHTATYPKQAAPSSPEVAPKPDKTPNSPVRGVPQTCVFEAWRGVHRPPASRTADSGGGRNTFCRKRLFAGVEGSPIRLPGGGFSSGAVMRMPSRAPRTLGQPCQCGGGVAIAHVWDYGRVSAARVEHSTTGRSWERRVATDPVVNAWCAATWDRVGGWRWYGPAFPRIKGAARPFGGAGLRPALDPRDPPALGREERAGRWPCPPARARRLMFSRKRLPIRPAAGGR
jgi:hypothetical protein